MNAASERHAPTNASCALSLIADPIAVSPLRMTAHPSGVVSSPSSTVITVSGASSWVSASSTSSTRQTSSISLMISSASAAFCGDPRPPRPPPRPPRPPLPFPRPNGCSGFSIFGSGLAVIPSSFAN